MPKLINASNNATILEQLETASTFWQRFKGLQLRHPLPADAGLMITPCSSLHTCFMRFAIDVVMLDKELNVLGVRENVKPWRMVLCAKQTTSVIETTHGSRQWTVGQKLEVLPGNEGPA